MDLNGVIFHIVSPLYEILLVSKMNIKKYRETIASLYQKRGLTWNFVSMLCTIIKLMLKD